MQKAQNTHELLEKRSANNYNGIYLLFQDLQHYTGQAARLLAFGRAHRSLMFSFRILASV